MHKANHAPSTRRELSVFLLTRKSFPQLAGHSGPIRAFRITNLGSAYEDMNRVHVCHMRHHDDSQTHTGTEPERK